MSMAQQQLLDDYDDLDIEDTWDEHIVDDHTSLSRHDEMLRQDRNRMVWAGVFGLAVAVLMIGGSYTWVRTMRAPAYGDAQPSASISSDVLATPDQAAQPAVLGRSNVRNEAVNDAGTNIEAKLHALAPHEALAVSPLEQAGPKRVKAERIETKVD